jgi:YVTN family beta-propeller protein
MVATVGGRRGLLAPASSRVFAGEPYFANHLRFFWREGGTRYAATLHNFGPGTRTVLGALVSRLRTADRLGVDTALSPGVERIPVPTFGPVAVASHAEAVWVAATGGLDEGYAAVVGIDPDSREVASEPIRIERSEGPSSLAADGSVWVAHAALRTRNALRRLNPEGDGFAQSIEAGPTLTGVAVTDDAVWAADLGGFPGARDDRGGAVERFDHSGRLVARIPVGGAPAGIALGEGSVWVTNNLDDTVSRIDPRTNRVAATIRVGGGPAGLSVGEGAVWVANSASDTISAIDPEAGRVYETIAVGRAPRGVAVGKGSVWVTNSLDDTVSRIDPHSRGVIETIRVGAGPAGIAVGHRAVWVASTHDQAISRIEP